MLRAVFLIFLFIIWIIIAFWLLYIAFFIGIAFVGVMASIIAAYYLRDKFREKFGHKFPHRKAKKSKDFVDAEVIDVTIKN